MAKIKGARFTRKAVRNVTADEHAAFMTLGLTDSYGVDMGCIRSDFQRLFQSQHRGPHQVFIARVNGVIRAWGLLRFYERADKPPFYQCYTHPDYRRGGLASTMIDMAKRHTSREDIFHIPHDEASEEFFKAAKLVKHSRGYYEADG